MNPPPSKRSYHPLNWVAFHLDFLPKDLIDTIPQTTLHYQKNIKQEILYGHEWYLNNRHLFSTLQQVANNNALIKINKVLIRVVAVKRFMAAHKYAVKENIAKTADVVTGNVQKITRFISLKKTPAHPANRYQNMVPTAQPKKVKPFPGRYLCGKTPGTTAQQRSCRH